MSKNNTQMSFQHEWASRSRKIGTIMIPLVMFTMAFPVIYLKIAYDVFPEWSVALTAWGTIAAMFWAYYFVEPFSYFPMLGLSGSYMAWTAGSVSDVRVPAAVVAQDAVGVKYGTDEASVVSTIGIAGSIFTTLTIVFITALFGTVIIDFIPENILNGIKAYTVPAVFAAVYAQFCKFEPKLSFIIVIAAILYFFLSGVYALLMVLGVIIPIIIARFLYKKGIISAEE